MSGQKFSLTFTKKVEKRVLEPSAIRNETRVESSIPAAQTLHAIEGKSLQIDETEAEKKELVIPLVQDDRAALLKRAQTLVEAAPPPGAKKLKTGREKANGNDDCRENKKGGEGGETEGTKKPLTLDEQAATALIEESQRKLESWQDRDKGGSLTIPASSSASNLRDSQPTVTKAKEATLDDYEEITVSSFGAAMLRGMGWKKGEGVGRIGKRVVEIIDPAALTFTLAETRKRQGLEGQDTGNDNNTQRVGQEEELMPVVKGAHVFIHTGRQKGTYGVIETVDEDHVLLKAAVSGNIIREVELNLRVVTQHEFKESSRVINKDMYDRYKEEEARQKSEHKRKKPKSSDSRDGKKEGSSDRETKHTKSPDQSNQVDRQKESIKQDNTPRNKLVTEDSASEKGIRNHDREEKHQDRIRGTDEQREFRRHRDENAEKGSGDRGEGGKLYTKGSKSKQHMDFNRDEDRHSVRKDGDEKSDDRSRDGKHVDNGVSKRKLKDGRERDGEHSHSKYKGRRDFEEEQQGRDGKSKVRREREEEYIQSKFKGREKESHSRMKVEREREGYEYGSTKSNNTTAVGREKERYYKEKEKRVERKMVEEVRQVQQPLVAVPWVRENLRVRLISRTYRGGKHHKEKVVVRSVVTAEQCECETEDGKLLMEVHPAWLETVIPKVPPHLVMIVRGDNKGQCARILQLHKDQEKASIQLLEEETTLLKLHYDDICEYVRR